MTSSPKRERGAISITALSQLAWADEREKLAAPFFFAC
jgi:hypothetical protein